MTFFMRLALIAISTALFASPALADQRRIGLTSFDRIDISGDVTVEIRNDYRIGATVIGSRDALDSLEVQVTNRTLQIRQLAMGRFGPRPANAGPVVIRVSAQNLRIVFLQGAGTATIYGLRGAETQLFLNGAGSLTVTDVATDNLILRSTGNGLITLTGRARSVTASINGGSTVIAAALASEALRVTAVGSGTSSFAASRTAELSISGSGGVTVDGRPACTVRNLSSGNVRCGTDQRTALPRSEN